MDSLYSIITGSLFGPLNSFIISAARFLIYVLSLAPLNTAILALLLIIIVWKIIKNVLKKSESIDNPKQMGKALEKEQSIR